MNKLIKKMLYVDLPGHCALPHISILNVISNGCEVISVTSIEAALLVMQKQRNIDILVINEANEKIFTSFRNNFEDGVSILVTDRTMDEYAASLSYKEELLIDHVVAHISSQEWMVNDLRITLQKIIRDDIFGIQKYLRTGTEVFTQIINDPSNRRKFNQEVMTFASDLKLSSQIAKLSYGICEELLMNAVFDAPVSKNENKAADETIVTNKIEKNCDNFPRLYYGCDGKTLAICVVDSFGGLQKKQFHNYLKKVIRRHEGSQIIDTKKGGAGLGLFKILFSSHSLVCNCVAGEKTEVISLINLESQLRNFSNMARCLHYFSSLKTNQ